MALRTYTRLEFSWLFFELAAGGRYPHFPHRFVPPIDRPGPDVVVIVILSSILHHCSSESDVDPPTVFRVLPGPLGDRVQPVGLRPPTHENHVAAS